MKRLLGLLGSCLMVSGSLGGCTLVEGDPESQVDLPLSCERGVDCSVTSCDDERSSALHLQRDTEGTDSIVSLGDDGYALFSDGYGVVTLDAAGKLKQELSLPSEHLSEVKDLVQMADGSFWLSGVGGEFGGSQGWVVKVDADWNPLWETKVGGVGASNLLIAALPDGGVLAAGTTWEPLLQGEPPENWAPTVFWERIDADGQKLWQRELTVDGFDGFTRDMRPMALTPDLEMRFVVPSTEGLVMIRSDLDGEFDSQLLDTTLAGYPSGIVALPDGRLAIGSTWVPGAVLSVLNSDGTVAWEKKYGASQDAEADAIAYDATRNELLLGGSYRGNDHGSQRTWMIATDLDGNQTFEMTREPQSTFGDGEVEEISADRGPSIRGLAVSPSGQIAALGATPWQLTYFLIEPGTCE